MFILALKKITEKKYIIQAILFFIAFMAIYLIVDSLNTSYTEMSETFGLGLVVTNIILNIV